MLLGRDRERQELDKLLATARTGHSAVLALVGEAGIGKTALLGYAEESAAGMRVLRARGIESEARVPFAALLELLRPTLGLLERIPPPQAAALEVALALRPGRPGDRFAVGAATLSLLAAYAEEAPTLVLLDDAHLLDAPSAESVLFALRRLLAEPIAALLAVRAGEPSLLDAADLPTLSVSGLDEDATASLLATMPRALSDRVHAATGGNPLALIELGGDAARIEAAAIASPLPVPDEISRAFAGRAESLEEPVRRLLVLVAASDSGELPAIERAATALGLDMPELAAAEETGLVRVADGRVEFRHPLARAAIYAQAPPEQRRAAHRALAAALPDRDADRRAWHLAAAALGTDERAAAALEQAAQRAGARSAYAVAALAYERAARLTAQEPRRGPLLFAAAETAWSAGLGERALSLLDEAQAHEGDRRGLVAIEHLRGRIATRRGPVMEGHAILVRAAELVSDSDPDLAVTMLAEGVDACFFAGDARAMQRTAQRAAELLQARASEQARFLAAITRGMALVFAGAGEDGIAAIREAVALAEGSQDLHEDVQLMPWLVMGPLWLREAQAGRVLVTAAIEGARARAELGVLPWLLGRVARSHAATADWSTARIQYDEAIALARATGQDVELAAGLAGLAWLDARTGRQEECRAAAAEARALCDALGVALYDTWAVRALGELELALGRPDAAVALFEEVEARLADLAIADPDLRPAAELVDAHVRLGHREEAGVVAERLAAAAREKGQPWSLARADRCRGLLADDGFEACFEDALALHELTPDDFERACTQLAYGARLRRGRRRRRAREELRGALDTFAALGAEPWVALAQGELAATGETARRRDASTLDELTPQELHIAQLLAAGRTTREAAAALFLSPKTIEYHLRSIYRKLGVNSRADLARTLPTR